jgi:hypothetical protein
LREFASGGKNAHIVELVEQEGFVLVADGVVGGEGGEFVG